jgi:hypothetical protein
MDVQAMGIYFKVHHAKKIGNLQPMALLEWDELFRSDNC